MVFQFQNEKSFKNKEKQFKIKDRLQNNLQWEVLRPFRDQRKLQKGKYLVHLYMLI